MRNPKFSVFQSEKKCLYYYRNALGKIILTEEGFVSKQSCENRISLIKLHASLESSYIRIDQPGNYSFHLKSPDMQIIAKSIIFTTKKGREHAIRILKKDASTAPVVDLSEVSSG